MPRDDRERGQEEARGHPSAIGIGETCRISCSAQAKRRITSRSIRSGSSRVATWTIRARPQEPRRRCPRRSPPAPRRSCAAKRGTAPRISPNSASIRRYPVHSGEERSAPSFGGKALRARAQRAMLAGAQRAAHDLVEPGVAILVGGQRGERFGRVEDMPRRGIGGSICSTGQARSSAAAIVCPVPPARLAERPSQIPISRSICSIMTLPASATCADAPAGTVAPRPWRRDRSAPQSGAGSPPRPDRQARITGSSRNRRGVRGRRALRTPGRARTPRRAALRHRRAWADAH